MAITNETLNIIITTKKKGTGEKQAKKGLDGLEKAAKYAGVALAAMAAGKVAVDLAKLGIQAQAAEDRFTAFAGGADQAAVYLEAFNRGTMGVVDNMTAMSSASKLLQMGLVGDAEGMEKVAAMASRLGDQTQGAKERIEGFALMLANQSIPRLDNYGISSGRVRKRIKELQAAHEDMSREAAFTQAVMEEGAKALEILGDTSESSAVKLDRVGAQWENVKQNAGLALTALVEATGILDGLAKVAEYAAEETAVLADEQTSLGDKFSVFLGIVDPTAQVMYDLNRAQIRAIQSQQEQNREVAASLPRWQQYSDVIDQTAQAQDDAAYAASRLADTQQLASDMSGTIERWNQYQGALDETAQAQDDAAWSALELARAEEDAAFAAVQAGEAQLKYSMAFTSQLDRMEETAQGFADKREEIESKHQEKIAELQKRGQSRAIYLNEDAERQKLADLKYALDYAQAKYDEMGANVAESTRMAKERRLAEAQAEYNAQQKLLDDYAAGRLVKTGENVDAEIAEANRLRDAKLAALDAEMAKQAEMQKQAMGRLLMQTFDEWGKNKDIPIEKMLEMRTGIAEEYGLVSKGATTLVTDMLGEWDRWASNTGITTGEVVDYMGAVVTETGKIKTALLELTAEEYVIKIRTEQTGGSWDYGEGGYQKPPDAKQYGGYARGGLTLVGERGPELVQLPRGARVFTAGQTAGMAAPQNNVTVYVTNPDPAAVIRAIENYMRLKGHLRYSMVHGGA